MVFILLIGQVEIAKLKRKGLKMRLAPIFALISSAVFGSPVTLLASESLGQRPVFVSVDAGEFYMGRAFSLDDVLFNGISRTHTERHRVTLTRGFEIQTTEVTQGQWFTVMGHNPSAHGRNLSVICPDEFVKIGDVEICPNHPVDGVSWHRAQKFIEKLNKKDNKYSYRLPTEAEWEFAARAGTETDFSFGDDEDDLKLYGWYEKNSNTSEPSRVAGLKPNRWGLYDMHGNVDEWVQDDYGSYSRINPVDPVGPPVNPKFPYKVLRGGNRTSLARHLRSSARGFAFPLHEAYLFGFRLVRTKGSL